MPSLHHPRLPLTAVFTRIFILLIPLFLTLFTFIKMIEAPPVQAMAVNCSNSSWSVGTEADFNDAISCFNGKTSAGNYAISFTQVISLTDDTTVIDNDRVGVNLVIDGDGFALDGQDLSNVQPIYIGFDTAVTLQNITIMRGHDSSGGGVVNTGFLTIQNSIIRDNTADNHSGGIDNHGVLTITHSTISGNDGGHFGGGISSSLSAELIIEHSTISNNSVTSNGGGIDNDGTLTIRNSTINGNSANSGGGIFIGGGNTTIQNSTVSGNNGLMGSAINLEGNATIQNSTISGNGGAVALHHNVSPMIQMDNNIISNPTATANCSRLFPSNGYNIDSDGSCEFSNTGDISNQDPLLGPLQDNGGATFTHALLEGSPAINAGSTTLTEDQRGIVRPQNGGDDIGAFEWEFDCTEQPWIVATEASLSDAINCYNDKSIVATYTISLTEGISLTTSPSSINNNTSGVELLIEGNDFAVDGQYLADVRPFHIAANTIVTIQNISIMRGDLSATLNGGGILNEGTLTVNNSHIKDNSADSGGGIYNNSTLELNNSTLSNNVTLNEGGGLFSGNSGLVTIQNSTFSENTAVGGGGAIYNLRTFTIRNSTIANNSAMTGGGIENAGGTLTVDNTIVANSLSGNDCSGTLTSNGYNLDSDGTCNFNGTGDISNQDPLLGPLQDNGGDTWTHTLLEDSPAIDAGNSLLTEDQRGELRPQGSNPDIGAIEVEATEFKIFMPLLHSP